MVCRVGQVPEATPGSLDWSPAGRLWPQHTYSAGCATLALWVHPPLTCPACSFCPAPGGRARAVLTQWTGLHGAQKWSASGCCHDLQAKRAWGTGHGDVVVWEKIGKGTQAEPWASGERRNLWLGMSRASSGHWGGSMRAGVPRMRVGQGHQASQEVGGARGRLILAHRV